MQKYATIQIYGGLAQPVRVPASHAGGRAFEPRSPHQKSLRQQSEGFLLLTSSLFTLHFSLFSIVNLCCLSKRKSVLLGRIFYCFSIHFYLITFANFLRQFLSVLRQFQILFGCQYKGHRHLCFPILYRHNSYDMHFSCDLPF